MAKEYDFVDAATQTVIDFLKSYEEAGRAPLLPHGYDAQDPEGMVSHINDAAFPFYDVQDTVCDSFSTTAITLCLDMANWRTVCAECGISYHEAPAPDPAVFTIFQLEVLVQRMREEGFKESDRSRTAMGELLRSFYAGKASAYQEAADLVILLRDQAQAR